MPRVNEATQDLWEYICEESVFDQNKIIPTKTLVGFLSLSANKTERTSNITAIIANWDGLVNNYNIRTGLGSKRLGLFEMYHIFFHDSGQFYVDG